jgi:hypothetical protein
MGEKQPRSMVMCQNPGNLGTENCWLMDGCSQKYGNFIGFDPSPYMEDPKNMG